MGALWLWTRLLLAASSGGWCAGSSKGALCYLSCDRVTAGLAMQQRLRYAHGT